MKKLIGLLCLSALFISTSLQSQDFIYVEGGERIVAKIIEVGQTEITYTLYGSNSRELLFQPISTVSMIAFENGSVKSFKKEEEKNSYDFKRNVISFHLADLVVSNFTMSYEHIMSSGKLGVQIPLALGYGNEPEVNRMKNKFYTGLNLNFYPTGQGKVRYMLGPGIRLGNGKTDINYINYTKREDTFYLKFMINNGLVISPIEEMSLAVVGSLGIIYLDKVEVNRDNVMTTGAFTFILSYRF